MIKNNGYEFLIKSQELEKIVYNMKMNISSCTPIMTDKIVKRVLYKIENTNAAGENQIRWIRIMEGDIDCNGEQRCTITYKDKKQDLSSEDYALLKVEHFEDATHLFDLLKYSRTSYQENLRSKFVCTLDDIKYIVRFDIWPKIEDVVVVVISVTSSASKEDIDGFVEALGISDKVIVNKNQTMVDVDSIYNERFGKPASLIPEITFDFDFDLS